MALNVVGVVFMQASHAICFADDFCLSRDTGLSDAGSFAIPVAVSVILQLDLSETKRNIRIYSASPDDRTDGVTIT
jgi:hypothetical protein